MRTLTRSAPVSGNNLTLSIDIELQRIAEEALGARKVLFGSGATEGSLVMQKAAILDADLTDDEKATVLYGAAWQVFEL